jgi:hypothetical protein
MSSDAYPGVGDRWDLAVAHALLAEHGVPAGVDGYDLTTLAAATYRFGWSYRIDRAIGMAGYDAEIQLPDGLTPHRAMGWEPEVALAFALSTALTARTRKCP